MTGAAPNSHSAAAAQRHELHLSGDLDLHTVSDLERAGTRALADPAVRTIALDLRRVTFIDSTGIGGLVRLRLAAHELGKHLVLTAPSEPVIRLLKITALTAAFTIDQTDATA